MRKSGRNFLLKHSRMENQLKEDKSKSILVL